MKSLVSWTELPIFLFVFLLLIYELVGLQTPCHGHPLQLVATRASTRCFLHSQIIFGSTDFKFWRLKFGCILIKLCDYYILNKSENEFINIAPESHWDSYNCLLWLIVAQAHIFTFNYLYFLNYYSGVGVNAVSWLVSKLHLLGLSKSLGVTLFVFEWLEFEANA